MLIINGEPLKVNRFPDGTFKLELSIAANFYRIVWLYERDEDMILYFIVNHIRDNADSPKIVLNMPYIPNARMDRVKNSTEVFTLKHFCKFINSLGFDRVTVRDAHSNVALALLDNVVSEDITPILHRVRESVRGDSPLLIFYPDEGSCKRYSDLLQSEYAFGIKNRDWATGKILGLDVRGALLDEKFDVLIIDDISSYGGTFYHSAKKLKELGANKIFLYVTHCEPSVLKGDLIGSGLVERIYTTDTIIGEAGEHPLIEVIGR